MNSTECCDRLRSRRSFIQGLAFASCAAAFDRLAGSAVSEPAPTRISVGSNIYGWSQYYQREGKDVLANLDEVLAALHDTGYDYLEGNLDVQTPDNNERFAERSRAKGLKPVCLYTGGRLHEADAAQPTVTRILAAAKSCQKAGFALIDCNPDPIGREKTDAELAIQAQALNDLGAGLSDLGLRLGVHNHTPEMTNQAHEFHYTLDRTKPQFVGLCYDVHWVFRGGIGPADCLRQYGSRVVSWHLRQSRNGIWWQDLDEGDVDYNAVALFAREHQLTAPLTVELAIEKGTAITRSAVENHKRSRDFVRRVFGV